jgi:Rod binding domain-containing protein
MDASAANRPPAIAPGAEVGPPLRPTADAAAAQKTGEDFEAFFLSQVFENMFAGIGTDPLFGGGGGETVYRSLLLQEYSKVAAKSGGVGIADAVQREILRAQEGK